MLRITGPYRSCPGRLRLIAGRLPLKMILVLLLAACTLQLSAHQLSASVSASLSPASPASPAHRYLHRRGAVRRAERRAARRCGCLQLTPTGMVVLLGAILLALAGIAMETVGIIRFRRTPQPAPGLFSPSEILEIYRLSLTSAAGRFWVTVAIFGDLLTSTFLPATTETWLWTNFITCLCLVVMLYNISRSGIPAQIETAKLEKLFAGISRLENLDSGAPGTTADATGRDGGI